jgi:Leucine-rich repeat (LRR) protein
VAPPLLVNLETLKLGRNRLVSLPSGLFRHNRRLRTLELANNHLRQVSGLLADLPALVHLDLCHNYLLSLGEGVFHNSPEIHTLLLGKQPRSGIKESTCQNQVVVYSLQSTVLYTVQYILCYIL